MKTKILYTLSLALMLSLFSVTAQTQVCFSDSPNINLVFGEFSQNLNGGASDTADFNNDGIQDVAINTNYSNPTLTIKLGNGQGGFTLNNILTLPAGTNVVSVINSDFNGDGNIDLAISDDVNPRVIICLGFGTGYFDTPTEHTISFNSMKLNSNDFNSDGKPDLAIFLQNDDTLLLLNTIPFVTITASADTVCAGISTTLTANGASSYSWSTGATTNNISASPSLTTTYTITGTTSGCTNTFSKTITVNQLPISNAGSDLVICSGATIGNIGTTTVNGYSYSWIPSVGLNDTAISNPTITLTNNSNLPLLKTYVVTTTNNATGCFSTDSVIVTVNPQPVLNITNPSAVCFPGTVNLTSSGITTGSTGNGTLTYWLDSNLTTTVSSPSSIGSTGTYYIKSTSVGGCMDTAAVNIVIHSQPTATFTTQNESSSLFCDGSIIANISGGTGIIQSEWFDSNQNSLSITNSISSLCAGTYTLVLLDSNGCGNNLTQTIQSGPIPQTQSICLITVDQTNTHNLLVWDKSLLEPSVDSIIIYRKIGTPYVRIGAVSKDSLSTFDDFLANPNVTGYRYKLTTKSATNVESVLSSYHNTIYLTNNGANFNWTSYQVEGVTEPVASYNLWRDDNSTGNFQIIVTTDGTQTGFTDINFSSFPNASYYVEAVMATGDCNPTRTFTGARSNKKSFTSTGITQNSLSKLKVYPNPANDVLNIKGIENQTSIRLFNIVGELVLQLEADSDITMDASGLTAGVYSLVTESKNSKSVNRIVITH